MTEFTCMAESFKITFVYAGCFRVIHTKTRTWFIVNCKTIEQAESLSRTKIERVFSNGVPKFLPSGGEKFIVTGLHHDHDTGLLKEIESIGFITGSHSRNSSGNGHYRAIKGEILTFDTEGEDNGFWYSDKDRKLDPEYYWKYTDGSNRVRLKGSFAWSLLWSEKIKQL